MEILKNNSLKEKINDITLSGGQSLDSIISTILLAAHPVGSLYWSSDNTDPGNLFGGTWTQITDTYIVAAGSSFTVGNTYGALTHKHTTGNHTLTATESGLPSHNHTISHQGWYNVPSNTTGSERYAMSFRTISGDDTSSDFGCSSPSKSATSGHNHGDTGDASSLPPSIVKYCWERTA